jgi:two-component system, OmpR family, heavy metal sensor histidine kinase CusS
VTIRTRISSAIGGAVVGLLLFMGVVLYYEFVIEHRAATSDAATDSVEKEIGEVLVFVGVPAMLILGLGSWWLVGRALLPLEQLADAATRIHASNLYERLPVGASKDEMARLATAFNGMVARLDASFAHVKEFTLHASHELKTPLTILHNELETALGDPDATSAQREMFARQIDEIQRLTQVVDGLTFLARMDAGQFQVEREPVRLDELVQDSFADAEILAHAAKLRVTLASCAEATVTGDRHRLRQVLLLNLVDNALKYNRPDGEVTLALTRHRGEAVVRIANTGVGVPPEALPRVFDPLFRADPARGRDVEGSGLGLSIARSIVTAHGGVIEITSERDRETVVTVRLTALEA